MLNPTRQTVGKNPAYIIPKSLRLITGDPRILYRLPNSWALDLIFKDAFDFARGVIFC